MYYIGILFIVILILFILTRQRSHIHKVIPYKHNTTIKIVNSDFSEGLPHTCDSDTIVIPENVWNSSHKEATLLHEYVHIEQRRNLDKWYKFYEEEWGYTKYDGLFNYIRPNPDTSDHPLMIWRKRYVFVSLFTHTRSLKDAKTHVYDVLTNAFVTIPDSWRSFFESDTYRVYQNEHPHEIAAEYLTKKPNTKAAQILYQWKSRNE
jgi:hypothetical protein